MVETRKVSFQDSKGNIYFLETSTDMVFDEEGNNLGDILMLYKKDLDSHKAEKASQDRLGHVKAGKNVTITEDGTLNVEDNKVDSVNGKTGAVVVDVSDIQGLSGSKLVLGRDASTTTWNYSVVLGGKASVTGNYGVALGHRASSDFCGVALGRDASTTGNYGVALGCDASATGDRVGVLGVNAYYNGPSEWKVPGSFSVSGTKNFEIPHPKPSKSATHVIRHGTVESPSAGDTLYRYKVQSTKGNDLQYIDLPDYFIYLNKDVQIFVTPQGHFGNGYGKLNRETEQLEIHCQYEGEYNILIIGTRNDCHSTIQNWGIMGVEKEIGTTWEGETCAYEVEEIREVEEIKEGY